MATFPHHYKVTEPKCVIRVDDKMYDVSTFRNSHPGGAELLDLYHNKDATDVFYAFHSQKAIDQVKRMKGRDCGPSDPQRDQISKDFMAFRDKLKAHGWFDRNWFIEAALVMAPVVVFSGLGTMIAESYPLIAALSIGVAMQQAGWIGHDYGHGRGKACRYCAMFFANIINGFSSEWWSHKHNTHHAFPNRKEVDADVHNEPILHLWFPSKSSDVWYRRYQYLFYPVIYAFLYVSWRVQSLLFFVGKPRWGEVALTAVGYLWLLSLPWKVAAGSILIGGWLVAIVVTANHQPEPMLERDSKHNFIVDQVVTTRGVECPDWITEYLFGGMQYQLEHHLFPFLPKYRYPALRPLVKKFVEEHGLEYKVDGIVGILKRNYEVMKKYSE